MKRFFYKTLPILLICTLFFMGEFSIFCTAENHGSVTILFTHDIHDHFYPMNVLEGDKIISVGGFSRLYSAIKAEREKDPELLLVDGGDFSMGTLFQTVFAKEAPQLRVMGKMGYHATTFGNHEFDMRAEGLADSLKAAKGSGGNLPLILSSNLSFPLDENGDLTPSLKYLKESMNEYGIKKYTTITRNGVKIGIFAVMGKDSASNAPMSEVVFLDYIENAKIMVDTLKNKEKVDLIVCLSHSGTSDKKSKSEDEILAKKVPGIDVIISGHSHTKLEEPIIVGNTVIGSCGENGENIGIIKLTKGTSNDWNLDSYSIRPIDDTLPEDPDIKKLVEHYKQIVQDEYLSKFNLKFEDILAYSPFNFTPASMLGKAHDEDILGNLIGDAYLYAIKEAEGENYETVTAAVIPYGTIRGSFVKGNITVSDTFNVSSLGVGPDKIPGYPIITVYLTGKELKTAAEVDASVTPIMNPAQLYISGLGYTFNPNRLIFNKVTEVYLQNHDGEREKINDNKLYRVAAGLYSAQMLSVVGDKSFNLLSIVPKTKEGIPIVNYEDHIVYNNDHELKEWLAIAEYLKSFDKTEGIPQVPLYYSSPQGRKVVDNSRNIIALTKNPNKIALFVYLVVIIFIAIIVFIVMSIHKKKRRRIKIELLKSRV